MPFFLLNCILWLHTDMIGIQYDSPWCESSNKSAFTFSIHWINVLMPFLHSLFRTQSTAQMPMLSFGASFISRGKKTFLITVLILERRGYFQSPEPLKTWKAGLVPSGWLSILWKAEAESQEQAQCGDVLKCVEHRCFRSSYTVLSLLSCKSMSTLDEATPG